MDHHQDQNQPASGHDTPEGDRSGADPSANARAATEVVARHLRERFGAGMWTGSSAQVEHSDASDTDAQAALTAAIAAMDALQADAGDHASTVDGAGLDLLAAIARLAQATHGESSEPGSQPGSQPEAQADAARVECVQSALHAAAEVAAAIDDALPVPYIPQSMVARLMNECGLNAEHDFADPGAAAATAAATTIATTGASNKADIETQSETTDVVPVAGREPEPEPDTEPDADSETDLGTGIETNCEPEPEPEAQPEPELERSIDAHSAQRVEADIGKDTDQDASTARVEDPLAMLSDRLHAGGERLLSKEDDLDPDTSSDALPNASVDRCDEAFSDVDETAFDSTTPESQAALGPEADAACEPASSAGAPPPPPAVLDQTVVDDPAVASAVPPPPMVLDPDAMDIHDASEPLPEQPAVLEAPTVLEPPMGIEPPTVLEAPTVLSPDGMSPEVVSPEVLSPQVLSPDSMAPQMMTPEMMGGMDDAGHDDEEWGSRPLSITPDKAELLQFLVADIRGSNEKIESAASEARGISTRDAAADTLREVASSLHKSTEFFEFPSLIGIADGLATIASAIEFVPEHNIDELLIRLMGISSLIEQLCCAFEVGMEMIWPLRLMMERIDVLLRGDALHPDLIGWHNGDPDRCLELDGVMESFENPPRPPTSHDPSGGDSHAAAGSGVGTKTDALPGATAQDQQVSVIRVESTQLEQIVGQVGHLVLCKNQLRQLVSRLDHRVETGLRESIQSLAEEFSLVTTGLQTSVMATRKQPMERLFKGFVRAIRDAARISDKEVNLRTVGDETMADKEMLDALTDPLITLLRVCVSLSVETTEQRSARGVEPEANVTIEASSQGTHLSIRVHDDGRGMDRERVIAAAIDAGLLEAESENQRISDIQTDMEALIEVMLRPGYPDPALRQVRDAIESMNGRLDPSGSGPNGLRFEITVPLNSAILPAMLVECDSELYAVPLQQIVEIVRYEPEASGSIIGAEVLRVRGEVYPIVRLHALFGGSGADHTQHAMIVDSGDTRFAIGVDRIVGQSEIVLRPMDPSLGDGPFCGLTIRDDSGLSLVLDLSRVAQIAAGIQGEHRDEGLARDNTQDEPDTHADNHTHTDAVDAATRM